MGYTTNFTGEFALNKPLAAKHRRYLQAFAETRRMKRDAAKAARIEDPIRLDAGLLIGTEGGYYVGSARLDRKTGRVEAPDFGQGEDPSVRDHNEPPKGQPGLWCQWVPNAEGTAIVWDEGEKFYAYVEWLQYLITHFLKPWDYVLSGEVTWEGEEQGDVGKIVVKKNVVTTKAGRIVYD